MTTLPTETQLDAAGRRFVDAAAATLTDLPVREREELMSDIADAVAELGDIADYDELVTRLGEPEAFAGELRRSSGLQEPSPSAGAVVPAAPNVVDRAVEQVSRLFTWAGRDLEPLWWLVRALVLALFVAAVGGPVTWATAVLVIVSFVLGIRSRQRGDVGYVRARGAGLVVGGALIFMVGLALVSSENSTQVIYESYPAASDGDMTGALTNADGMPVTNIYAFDRKGQRLTDVRLYDQQGMPLEFGAGKPEGYDELRRRVFDAGGIEYFNAFPIRYVEPGPEGSVADPEAGWPDAPEPLATESSAITSATPTTEGAAVMDPANVEPARLPGGSLEEAAKAADPAATTARSAAAKPASKATAQSSAGR